MSTEPGYEHNQLRGITIKNMLVTIGSTAMIVASVLTTYFNLKADMKDKWDEQTTQNRVTDIRLKVAEDNIKILTQKIDDLEKNRHSANQSH